MAVVVLGLSPPLGTQLLRNSQLSPSPTLSSQTEPVKTNLQWHFGPLLATARSTVHQQALEAQMLPSPGAKKAWADTVCETQPGKVCPGTRDLMCFFWLHPNQMELKICAGACPFIAGTGAYLFGHAGTESLLPAWPPAGSECLLLPVWKLVFMWSRLTPLANCSIRSVFSPVPCVLSASLPSSFRPPFLLLF